MIELAASRYQASTLIVTSGLVPVRITRGYPRFRLGHELGGTIMLLAPSRELLYKRDNCDFDAEYRAQLDGTGLDMIANALSEVSAAHDDRGLVLLCFEDVAKLGELSCHRRSFARSWYERTGRVVPELAVPQLFAGLEPGADPGRVT